jgi:hypothetical protein
MPEVGTVTVTAPTVSTDTPDDFKLGQPGTLTHSIF